MRSEKKKFITITRAGDELMFSKDVGMIPFTIGKCDGWESTIAYLKSDHIISNIDFEKYCNLICIGENARDDHKNREIIIDFIKRNIHKYDVVNFYNYGTNLYKYSYYCKKYNPKIIIWSKLDMGMGGYRHFYENNFLRKIKNFFERFKSQYVDLFSVETYDYYKNLKDNIMFQNRLLYFPNGLKLLENQSIYKKKENILLHVARIGSFEKNSELLIKALNKIKPEILKQWKIYLIGPYTVEFKKFLEEIQSKNKLLKDIIFLTGNISDRTLLYSYYAKSKIFCLTSRHESFGIAALEALYHKNYLLLSNYGLVVNDLTDNEHYGKVVDSFDSDVWAKEIEQAMLDEKITEKVKSAQEFVLNEFSYEINIKRLLKKIETIKKV